MEINNKYGYVRGQESDYSIEFQKQQLIKNGIEEKNIFVEIESGTKEIRNLSTFQKLINQKLKKNDLLMVNKINICSRNTLEFLKLQDILFEKSVTFVALDLPISIDLADNKVMAKTLSAIAKIENNRRRERQKQGILAAQKKGKYQGRKTVINKTLIQKVKYLKEEKELSVTDISKLTGVSCPTIYKVLKEQLGYISNRLIKLRVSKTEKRETKGRSTLKKCSIEQGSKMVTARNQWV